MIHGYMYTTGVVFGRRIVLACEERHLAQLTPQAEETPTIVPSVAVSCAAEEQPSTCGFVSLGGPEEL